MDVLTNFIIGNDFTIILYTLKLYSVKHKLCVCVCVLVTQSCVTLQDPLHCSLPGSSVHGILKVRILEWVAIPFAKGSSQPGNWTQVSCPVSRFFTIWAEKSYLNKIGRGYGMALYRLSG